MNEYIPPPFNLISAFFFQIILKDTWVNYFCVDYSDINYLEANDMMATKEQRGFISLCVRRAMWIISRKSVSLNGGTQFKYLKAVNMNLSHHPRLPL